jgi:exonuclease VII small subunit
MAKMKKENEGMMALKLKNYCHKFFTAILKDQEAKEQAEAYRALVNKNRETRVFNIMDILSKFEQASQELEHLKSQEVKLPVEPSENTDQAVAEYTKALDIYTALTKRIEEMRKSVKMLAETYNGLPPVDAEGKLPSPKGVAFNYLAHVKLLEAAEQCRQGLEDIVPEQKAEFAAEHAEYMKALASVAKAI